MSIRLNQRHLKPASLSSDAVSRRSIYGNPVFKSKSLQYGNVILVDFGLAITSELTRMTEHSGLVGSFDYLAPEQISNDTLDARCDVFSTSVILYYLVTGTLPFSRYSVASTLNAIQNDSIEEAFSRNPKVSRELGALISRGLQKKREDRFSSFSCWLLLGISVVSDSKRTRKRTRQST